MVIIEEVPSSSSVKYHVFLSFRGEDTRCNFTGHLYSALRQNGIGTFMDDQLIRGEEISQTLLQAIEESKISVIVFSKYYASSRWCLDELVKILECKKSNQQVVLPVFYKVDPSDIRDHRGSFGEGLANLERKLNDKNKIQIWKNALSEAACLSGCHLLDEKHSESMLVQEIVKTISKRLINITALYVAKYPVGIECRVQEIHNLLGVEGRDVHMLGIWGPVGIGKSTIARAVYNSIAHTFDGCCFLENVKENSEGTGGFVNLQKILLQAILKGTEFKEVASAARGITVIKERLRNKRVLLVLDDVNDTDQLDYLAGQSSWFCKGSKIIITTRDKNLLRNSDSLIYKVPELAYDEALELFSWNAFKRNRPLDGFAELTKLAIQYAQGLPLVLIVLGSSLYGRAEVWEAALNVFKSCSKIQDVLEISYHGLDDGVKEVFLDIACFFKGKKRDQDVLEILKTCGHADAQFVINVLEQLGRNIVSKQSPVDPGVRSRLRFHNDVYRVLTKNIRFTNLTSINMSECQYLTEVSDLSGCPDLQRLILDKCGNLVKVHPSVGFLDNLTDLSLGHCYKLESFPTEVSWRSMTELQLPFCRRLQNFITPVGKMECIKEIDLFASGKNLRTN